MQTDMIHKRIGALLPLFTSIAKQYNRQGADDIAQDVALKLLQTDPSHIILDCPGWIRKVVRNVAYDHCRRVRQQRLYIDASLTISNSGFVCERGNEHDAASVVPASAKLYDDMESYLIPTVRDHLAKLPAQQRRCLVLYAAGYSYGEIAQITASGVGTVRSRIHYGRNKLKELMKR